MNMKHTLMLLTALLLTPLAALHADVPAGNATFRGTAGSSDIVITMTNRLAAADAQSPTENESLVGNVK
jgi:type 1 fimbria pilin